MFEMAAGLKKSKTRFPWEHKDLHLRGFWHIFLCPRRLVVSEKIPLTHRLSVVHFSGHGILLIFFIYFFFWQVTASHGTIQNKSFCPISLGDSRCQTQIPWKLGRCVGSGRVRERLLKRSRESLCCLCTKEYHFILSITKAASTKYSRGVGHPQYLSSMELS